MKSSLKDDIKVISKLGWDNSHTSVYLKMSSNTLDDVTYRNREPSDLGLVTMRKVPYFRRLLEDISNGGIVPTKDIVESIAFMKGLDFSSFINIYYAKEENLVYEIIDSSVKNFLARHRIFDYLEEFKARFGGAVSEASLTKAAISDSQFLSEFIIHGKINNTTRAIALSKLGLALDDSLIGFIKTYTKDVSSLVREGAYQGLAEYYFENEKKYAELLTFFKSALKQEVAEGVQKQILNLINVMEDFRE